MRLLLLSLMFATGGCTIILERPARLANPCAKMVCQERIDTRTFA
jgi:hypothetical protein